MCVSFVPDLAGRVEEAGSAPLQGSSASEALEGANDGGVPRPFGLSAGPKLEHDADVREILRFLLYEICQSPGLSLSIDIKVPWEVADKHAVKYTMFETNFWR